MQIPTVSPIVIQTKQAELDGLLNDSLPGLLLVGASDGLQKLAASLSGKPNVHCCSSRQEAIRALESLGADAVLFDWVVPRQLLPERQFCESARSVAPEVTLIAVTPAEAVKQRLEAFASGVDDCISYGIDAREVLARVRATTQRLRRPILARNTRSTGEVAAALAQTYRLSARERELLKLLAEGKQLKEIGDIVGCEYSTVRTHLRRACKKLQCSGTREALIKFFAFDPSSRPCLPT